MMSVAPALFVWRKRYDMDRCSHTDVIIDKV